MPHDPDDIKRARNSLLKCAPKYTLQFIELIHEHKAARRRDMEALIAPGRCSC